MAETDDVRRYFLHDPQTGRYRLSPSGREYIGKDMARLGFDPRKSYSREQMLEIVKRRFGLQMEAFASEAKGTDPELDAVLRGMPGWD